MNASDLDNDAGRTGGGPGPAVVLFDLDDTLFAHRGAVAEGIVRHLGLVGGRFASVDSTDARTLWDALEEKHYHSYLAGTLDFQGQRRARARDFAAAHGVDLTDGEAAAWFDAYFVHYRDSWRLHEDALSCLDELARVIPGVRFGLITNGELAFQREKLMATGLDERVEHVIASGELDVAKPDPRIFVHACAAFGVGPEAAAYVGDRLRTDAIGAAAAGLTGVWLDRLNAKVPEADLVEARRLGVIRITALAALPDVLAPPPSPAPSHRSPHPQVSAPPVSAPHRTSGAASVANSGDPRGPASTARRRGTPDPAARRFS